ncbi:MAG: translocation/assembly module TamB domain-containing protein [Chloracidobacterium sp.]|nr:translocation/assembly module TamB domain-containing protein [Chloracidobacterium sp.]MDW8216510.1 translocation/assembly module TamB domain-containing protein [Acidobacteriota bacterium]
MARREQTLRLVGLGLALAVVGGLTALTVWVTRGGLDDWARRTLITELERQTDIRADIGELHVHLFSMSVEAVRIACFLPGDAEPFLTADRLTAEIAVESLWRQRFTLRHTALERPKLTLVFDERGFNLSRIRMPRRKRTLPQEPDEPLMDETFHGGRVVIRDGKVRIGAATYGVRGQVADVGVFGYTGDGRTLQVTAGFDQGGVEVTNAKGETRSLRDARVRLTAKVKKDAADITSLVVTTPLGELTAAGEVRWPDKQVRYAGNAYLTLDLTQTSQSLLGGLPLAGRVQMPARFSGDTEHFTLEGNLEPLAGRFFGVAATGLSADYRLEAPFDGFPSRAEADVKAGRIVFGGYALDGFSAHVAVSPEFVDVTDLTARTLGGRLRGRTRLAYPTGTRDRSTAKLTAEGLDVAQLVHLARLPSRGLTGRGSVQADLSWPGLDAAQVGGQVQVRFTGQAPSAEDTPQDDLPLSTEARGTLTPGVITIEALVARIGTGTLTASGRYRWRTREVDARLDYHTPELYEVQTLARRLGFKIPALTTQTADAKLELRGAGDITATVTGRPSALAAAGTASVSEIRVNNQCIGRAAVQFEASPTRLAVMEASLIQPDGGCLVAAFDGGWTDDRPTQVKCNAYELKLASLGAIACSIPATKALGEQLMAWGGRADGDFHLTGLPTLRTLQAGLAIRDWTKAIERVRGNGTLALTMVKTPLGDLKRGEARVSFQDDGLALEGFEARFPSGVVTGQGSYHPADGAYSVALRSDGLDALTLARAFGQPDLPLAGVVRLEATSASTINRVLSNHLDFKLRLDSDKLTIGGDEFKDVCLAAASDAAGEKATLTLTARYRDYPYRADATVTYLSPDGEPAFLVESQFDFDRTPLTPVLAIFDIGPQNLGGEITGRLRLSGPLYVVDPVTDTGGFTTSQLTLTGDFSALRLVIPLGELGATVDNYVVVNDGPLQFLLSDRALDFTQFRLKDEKGDTTAFTLGGRLGLSGGRDVVTAEGRIDLKLLRAFSKRVTSRGLLTIKAKIAGSLLNPRLAGYADIDDFGLRITELPVALENGGGRILFNANRAQIEALTADAGGGKIEVTGGAIFERLTDVRWRFGLRAENIRVKYPRDIRSLADGDLVLQGNRSLQVLSGVVRIKRAEYTTNTDLATLVQTQFIGLGGIGASLQTRGKRRTFTTLDVRVEAPDTLFIRNNIADVVGSASLRLSGSLDDPDVSGRILITRGQLEFRNDRFEVTRGVVSIPEGPTGGTFYDIQAEATIQGYRIIVGLTGTADNFNPVLRSEPNLPQSSILSLLATGRLPPPNIANTPTAAQQANVSAATTLLSELLTERIEEQTGRLFGINRFQIDPLLVGRGGDPTARLTVGRRITKDLSVTFSTNLATAEEQIILIEYRLRNNLSIIGLRDQRGNFGFDVRITKRF